MCDCDVRSCPLHRCRDILFYICLARSARNFFDICGDICLNLYGIREEKYLARNRDFPPPLSRFSSLPSISYFTEGISPNFLRRLWLRQL